MGKKQEDPRGKQKGAQAHAEGQHGEKTHERFLEEIQAPGPETRADVEQRDRERSVEHAPDGGHRIVEARAQHDPADRASDQNRLDVDIDQHKHERDRYQVPHGSTSHPALPDTETDVRSPHKR